MKYLFTAIMFLIGTDTFIVSPLLPTLRTEFGIGVDTSGWLVSAYAVGYALTAVFAGPLTDRMDRKKALVAGLTGFAVFSALCGTATGFSSMLVYRLCAGVFAAIASPQVWASIPQTVPGPLVPRTMGWAAAGLSLAQVLGIPLGTTLAAASWRWPFWAVGLLTLPVVWWIIASLPSIKPTMPASARQSFVSSYRQLLGNKESRTAFAAHFCFFIGTFGSFTYIGNWMADEFQLNVGQIGCLVVIYGAGNMAGSLLGSRLVQRWGRRNTLTVSLLLIGTVFVTAPHLHNLTGISLLLFCSSFAGGLSFPLAMTILQSLDTRMRGTISSLANSVMYLGTTAGSAVAGRLYVQYDGFSAVGLMVLAAMAASLLFYYRSGVLGSAGSRPELLSSANPPANG